ncbi:hypothetical protein L579_3117 [Pantoea sp. AS-PWVM4]|nr:hypothetical protein L579_3117 [Pantoea sp. AS-PWVM4]
MARNHSPGYYQSNGFLQLTAQGDAPNSEQQQKGKYAGRPEGSSHHYLCRYLPDEMMR